jgi:uncharacterized membrane protein
VESLAILVILAGVIGLPVGALVLLIVMWHRLSRTRDDLARLADRVEWLERRPPAPAPADPVARPVETVRPGATSAPPHAAPPAPGPLDPLLGRARAWLLGGNLVVRVGVIVLFFGVAFFLNYAMDRGWLPVELRLALAALGGLGLVALGWRLREVRRDYALVLQGGGVGIVYLTVFAAASAYDLVAPGAGLILMVGLVAGASGLALLQDAPSLAVLASLGGFLAPVLVGEGGSHVALFGYYAALNAGIVAMAWFRTWRSLNVLGFLATFVITGAWGWRFYQPAYFASTEPFLVAFFLCYVAVPVLGVTRQPDVRTPRLDGMLLFGVPLAAFALQQGLVRDFEYGLATSALVTGLFYGALTRGLRRRPEAAPLTQIFTALGAIFTTLAIPFAFDGQVTGGAWALEGAGLVWIGLRQQRERAWMSGVLLQGAAGYLFLLQLDDTIRDVPVLNSIWLGAALVSAAGLFSGRYLDRHAGDQRVMPGLPTALLWWGLAWWTAAGLHEIDGHVPGADAVSAAVLFLSGTAAATAWLRARLAWPALAVPARLLLPALAVLALAAIGGMPHPLARWGVVAWSVALGSQIWIQWRLETEWPDTLVRWWHAGMLWLVVALGMREAAWSLEQITAAGAAWRDLWIVVAAAAIAGVPALVDRVEWPFARYAASYRTALVPLVILASGWIVVESTAPGSPAPLPYVPLLNPLELTQGLVLAILLGWSRRDDGPFSNRARWTAWAVLAFVGLNGVIARATHFYGGVPFDVDALWASARYQTAVSIVWTAAALTAMLGARWLRERAVWFVGAALLALVVGKLFLVDLNDVGTIARIVSFIVVGMLILVVGYVSPLPPRATPEARGTRAP